MNFELPYSSSDQQPAIFRNKPEIQQHNFHSNYKITYAQHKYVGQRLKQFQDDQIINLEISIPVLRAAGIFIAIQSIQQAKNKLEAQEHSQNSRLRLEAKFLYYLWQLINQEEIDCRELKQIIELSISKDAKYLRDILLQIYNSQQKVDEYVQACIALFSHTEQKQQSQLIKTDNYFSFESKKNSVNYPDKTQNNYDYPSHSNIASSIKKKSPQRREPLKDTSNFLCHNINYNLQLSSTQQKQLVSRLYRNDLYKQREQQKQEMQIKRKQQQLKQCTFKPNVGKRGRSVQSQRPKSAIKGYDKAINRLKTGGQKSKMSKQLREYKPVGQNYEKLRQKGINPPKFLNRAKKEQEKVLFIISFDLGRYKTNVKIREGDTEQSVAQRLCKIYSLKQDFHTQICDIVRNQLEIYYQELYQAQSTNNLSPFPHN